MTTLLQNKAFWRLPLCCSGQCTTSRKSGMPMLVTTLMTLQPVAHSPQAVHFRFNEAWAFPPRKRTRRRRTPSWSRSFNEAWAFPPRKSATTLPSCLIARNGTDFEGFLISKMVRPAFDPYSFFTMSKNRVRTTTWQIRAVSAFSRVPDPSQKGRRASRIASPTMLTPRSFRVGSCRMDGQGSLSANPPFRPDRCP